MQFRDLKKQYEVLKTDIDAGIAEVINSTSFISGKAVVQLEEKLADYVGVKHCITCANGTDALSLALMAWGVGQGDCVFVPNFTFFASAETVMSRGAIPIFVDVDKQTFNMDASKLEAAIEKVLHEGTLTPKVIVTVDLFGLPANYDEIKRVSEKYNLLILEDAAQGFGGEYKGKRACSFGNIATTSFFPAKPLGCYGDGGAIFTDDDKIAELLRSLRIHGKGTDKYDNVRIGVNSRLDTMQAAILLVKFKAFVEYELDAVNKAAQKYTNLLKDIVITPFIPHNCKSSWAQYCIMLDSETERDELVQYLKGKDIPTMVYYPKTMSEQRAFDDIVGFSQDLEISLELCKVILALPMHPYLEDADIEYIAGQIRDWKSSKK